jgi:hydrogenase maturation protease
MSRKVLVAGIGNIFLGDDAFGVEVVTSLRNVPLPEYVSVVDFGVRSYDLAYALMDPWDLVILVDALPHGGKPGTLYTIEPDCGGPHDGQITLDAHSMTPVAVLQLVQALGGHTGPLLVVGCEPATVEPDQQGNFGLSDPVKAAVDEAVQIIQELIERTRTEASAA